MGNCFKLSKVATEMRGYSYDTWLPLSRFAPLFTLSLSLCVCLFVCNFPLYLRPRLCGARGRVGINLRLSISIITFEVSFK